MVLLGAPPGGPGHTIHHASQGGVPGREVLKGKIWVPLGGYPSSCSPNTVDGRNPVNSPVEGKVVYPIIYRHISLSWMSRWKLGSMVSKLGCNLLINGVFWDY